MGAVAVVVDVLGVRNRLPPRRSSLELKMVDPHAGIYNVYIDALATVMLVRVDVEGAEAESVPVRNPGKSPRRAVLGIDLRRRHALLGVAADGYGLGGRLSLVPEGVIDGDDRVAFDIFDFGEGADVVQEGFRDVGRVATESVLRAGAASKLRQHQIR